MSEKLDLECYNKGNYFVINNKKQKFNTIEGIEYSNRYKNFHNKLNELWKNIRKNLNNKEYGLFECIFHITDDIYDYDDFLDYDDFNVCTEREINREYFVNYINEVFVEDSIFKKNIFDLINIEKLCTYIEDYFYELEVIFIKNYIAFDRKHIEEILNKEILLCLKN